MARAVRAGDRDGDLTDARLQVAARKHPGGGSRPRRSTCGHVEAAGQRLSSCAIDEAGAATAWGRTLASLPLDPPLGRASSWACPERALGARRRRVFVALPSATRVPGLTWVRWSVGWVAVAPVARQARTRRQHVKETRARLERLAQRPPASASEGAPHPLRLHTGDAASRTRDELALRGVPEDCASPPGSAAFHMAGAELPQGSLMVRSGWPWPRSWTGLASRHGSRRCRCRSE